MTGIDGTSLSTTITNELQFSATYLNLTPTSAFFNHPVSCTASGGFLNIGGCTASVSWNNSYGFNISNDVALGIGSNPFNLIVYDLAYTSFPAILGTNSDGGASVFVNYFWTASGLPGVGGTSDPARSVNRTGREKSLKSCLSMAMLNNDMPCSVIDRSDRGKSKASDHGQYPRQHPVTTLS